jgi:hypothetical protein
MKNVVGLANAMKVVESACDTGEITIIGNGVKPTPVELLAKCVEFINKQYGVDVLDLLVEMALRKDCGDCCCDCCGDYDDDDEEIIEVVAKLNVLDIIDEVEGYLDNTILSYKVVLDFVSELEEYLNVVADIIEEKGDREEYFDSIYESLEKILAKVSDGVLVDGGVVHVGDILDDIMEIIEDNVVEL